MLFNQEMDEVRNKPSSVEFQTPLKIQLYPAKCLRMKNEQVTVFDDKLKDLAQQMFKIMYETDGCGLAAPQVGVNYRLMVYNESGRPDEGKEVVLVNPKISKYSNQKDFFEEGCLSFPEINAEVEVSLIIFDCAILYQYISLHFFANERLKHKYTLIRVSFEAMRRNVSKHARLSIFFHLRCAHRREREKKITD
jgi:hypothetical protein